MLLAGPVRSVMRCSRKAGFRISRKSDFFSVASSRGKPAHHEYGLCDDGQPSELSSTTVEKMESCQWPWLIPGPAWRMQIGRLFGNRKKKKSIFLGKRRSFVCWSSVFHFGWAPLEVFLLLRLKVWQSFSQGRFRDFKVLFLSRGIKRGFKVCAELAMSYVLDWHRKLKKKCTFSTSQLLVLCVLVRKPLFENFSSFDCNTSWRFWF